MNKGNQSVKTVSKEEANKAKKATKPEAPKATFEVKGKKYRFRHGQYTGLAGKLWMSSDALNNPVELERLVIEKCGVIEAVK